METKHTPGPWWVGEEDSFDGIAVMYRDGMVPVANVQTGYTDRNSEANARLIAAAPDLLAACVSLSSMEIFTESAADDDICIITVATVRKIRAAIAKATGAA